MALFLTPNPYIVLRNPNSLRLTSVRSPVLPISCISISSTTLLRRLQFRIHSSLSGDEHEIPIGNQANPGSSNDENSPGGKVFDEWGEEAEPEETSAGTRMTDADPPKGDDEWGADGDVGLGGNGSAAAVEEGDRVGDLKRSLVDTFYGTELGFRASPEVRAEVLELVNQLEAVNPTPAPVEVPSLGGNWVLMYTAFSELLPILATGSTPLLKVKRICQMVDTRNLTIDNTATLSSPFADFSFSASATFEVRSPSRIQVQFKEGILKPPEIQSTLALPENVDIFGQRIDLLPVQRFLNPLQEAMANLARGLSGQPPLKLPLPGNSPSSWLIITYLDDDLRISRGDGGLFILAKEGSPLLDQLS